MWINADVDGNGMALQQTGPKTTVQLASVNSKIFPPQIKLAATI
jgi:hypothetical protein